MVAHVDMRESAPFAHVDMREGRGTERQRAAGKSKANSKKWKRKKETIKNKKIVPVQSIHRFVA